MIHPCGHRVLIRPQTVEEMTEGGLYLPEMVKDKLSKAATTGELVAVGSQAWKSFANAAGDDPKYAPPWAEVGDVVVFCKYAGSEVREDGVEYRLCNDEDVLGVIRKATA